MEKGDRVIITEGVFAGKRGVIQRINCTSSPSDKHHRSFRQYTGHQVKIPACSVLIPEHQLAR